MNKRIAKKILSIKQQARRCYLWRLGYGPEHGPWPIEWKARRYLDRRRGTPYNRTMRIVRTIGGVWGTDTMDEVQIERLVNLWDEHRPYIWRAIRGGRRNCPVLLIPGESIEEGRKVGERECDEYLTEFTTLPKFVLGTLFYFSDRWCVSRMGRMDAMIDRLRR